MTPERPAGRVTKSVSGADDLAGKAAKQRDRQRADAAEDVEAPLLKPGEADLDARDHRQSQTRKPPGPTRGRKNDAEPAAPSPGAPPPTDPS